MLKLNLKNDYELNSCQSKLKKILMIMNSGVVETVSYFMKMNWNIEFMEFIEEHMNEIVMETVQDMMKIAYD